MLTRLIVFLLAAFIALPAKADAPVLGAPTPEGIDLQTAYSPLKHALHNFHDYLLVIITVITIIVMCLLAYVIVRYNKHTNPVPRKFAHNTLVEIIWTVIPIIIIVIIAIPSFKILYYLDKTPNPEMTLKATGHQWYWSYEYPDQKIESFDSRPIWDGTKQTKEQVDKALADAKPGWIFKELPPQRLLEVDNRVVLPINTNIRIYTAASDVIHSFAVASLGFKKDAVPGHLNETWVNIDHEGVFYGQCSQLCGTGHAYMPIVFEAVSKEKFAEWVKTKATPEAAPVTAKNSGKPVNAKADAAAPAPVTTKPVSVDKPASH